MTRHLPEYELGVVTGAPSAFYATPVIRLKIVRERSVDAPRRIKRPTDAAAALMERFGTADREVFVAVLLDTKNRVLAIDPCFVGNLNTNVITMREAFKSAVLVGAAAVDPRALLLTNTADDEKSCKSVCWIITVAQGSHTNR